MRGREGEGTRHRARVGAAGSLASPARQKLGAWRGKVGDLTGCYGVFGAILLAKPVAELPRLLGVCAVFEVLGGAQTPRGSWRGNPSAGQRLELGWRHVPLQRRSFDPTTLSQSKIRAAPILCLIILCFYSFWR